MRKTWTRMALATVIAVAGLAATPMALAQGTGSEVRVDLNLRDADMKAAIQVLMKETGMSIIFEASEEPFPKVTLNLPRVTAEDALMYICQAAGVYFRKDDNGVYIISRKRPEVKPVETPPNSTVKPAALARKVYKIKMMKADAQDVYEQMTVGIVSDPLRGFLEINRFKDVTSLNRGALTGSTPVYMLDHGDRNTTFSPVGTNNSTPIVNRGENANGVTLPGEAAGQFGGGPGFGGGGQGGFSGGGGGQGGLGGGGGGLGGGGGQGGQGGQGGLSAGGLIPEGIDYITYDPNDNSIIVRATEAEYQQLIQAISEFDTAPKQVTVKVEFITTTSSLSKSLGFDWLYSRGTIFAGNTPGTFARSGDPIFLSWQSGNFSTRLRALLQDGFGRVVASPVVRTLNNQPAFVSQGVNTVIFQSLVTSIGNGQVIRTTNPLQLTVGTQLALRPRINNDGTVTMFLTPSIQQLGQFRRDADGNEFPDTSFQQIAIVARVKSGDTIALAGFTNKSDNGTQSKFPVLGDLPIIGQFFRSTTREKNFSELLVFVTPTIMEDEDGGGIGP
ncbi:MAG: type II secretion system protein GspD [Methanoregulaceae archaeon]|nr:type II secretion system protein GspD [Methanoregulaceae archaeon]